MEEEITTKKVNVQSKKTKRIRPKPVCSWTVADVQKWYKRHCDDYPIYADLFVKHEITGRALLRLTDSSLQRMGIENNRDRDTIWRRIVKERLKDDMVEIRDLQFMNIYYE